jgi:RNA polymerase sigma factor (TIGR02999 family)
VSQDNKDRTARRSRLTELVATQGDLPNASTRELVELLYDELKVVANAMARRARPGDTMTATAIVNEAYFQLARDAGSDPHWNGRAHFFGAAARAMRNVIADYWRAKNAGKRGGDLQRVSLHTAHHPVLQDGARFEDLNRALAVLESEVPRAAEVVLQRIFLGFTVPETAEALGVSVRTVEREWTFAKAFLATHLGPEPSTS